MVTQTTQLNHCDKDVTQTNLLLATLLLKTTDENTRLTDNPPLMSVIQSICNSSELYFSRSTPLQPKKDNVFDLRAINDSNSICNSSLSLPSSVHVADVTHDKCHAYEHSACHGVSAAANETNANCNVILEESEGLSVTSTVTSTSRKRQADPTSIHPTSLPLSKRVAQVKVTSNHAGDAISSFSDLKNYIQGTRTSLKTVEDSYNSIARSATDLFQHVQNMIDLCSHDDLSYVHHSVVILEHSSRSNSPELHSERLDDASDDSAGSKPSSHQKYFVNNTIQRLIAIERPSTRGQVYVASGLWTRYHFSCPTMLLPELYDLIRCINNPAIELIFIPRTTCKYELEGCVKVVNGIDLDKHDVRENCNEIHDTIITMPKSGRCAKTKRSMYSLSVGLQTMYSHQQHLARYCMLPHSKPHVTTVKKHPRIVMETISLVYNIANDIIMSDLNNCVTNHPFFVYDQNKSGDTNDRNREMLRKDLQHHLTDDSIMFESCTVQPTASLGFHLDSMNCPDIDNTIACFIPCSTNHQNGLEDMKCLSFLYYSRKCVSDYSKRLSNINYFLNDTNRCGLTQLCVRSMMQIGSVFDYQGSLFEVTSSLKSIAKELENKNGYSCHDIAEFTGLSCFKHGAAFDKMGYYSIFVNVFCSLHYLGFIQNVDDSISLSIFFGFICNGTSSLAAVWNELKSYVNGALKYYERKTNANKLFQILIKLDKRRQLKVMNDHQNESRMVLGNCKLPRFQYANYGDFIVENCDKIHSIVKDFMQYRGSSRGSKLSVSKQHSYLFGKLHDMKGIGPLSFNQFWHALCLCGILPHHYMECSAIGPSSGPAKLIQAFHPNLKSGPKLLKKLADVRAAISNLGFIKVTDFFLENMFCEVWRIANERKLFTKNMSDKDIKEILSSSRFQSYITDSKVTRRPDIYFCNPFTEDYQHLFRVVDKALYMRPSFLDNEVGRSVQLQIMVSYENNGVCEIKWQGDYLRRNGTTPSDMFVKRMVDVS